MISISVISPIYNSSAHLEKHLKILRELSSKHMVDIEIILVDTGSSDDSVAIAKKLADKVFETPDVSRGVARNIGAKNANRKILAFLDSDCEITENWMLRACNLPEEMNEYVFGGPVILDSPNSLLEEPMRNLLLDPFFTCKSSSFSLIRASNGVKELSTANLLISKAFFEKLGGFPDVDFNEDTLFCQKVRKQNGRIIYDLKLEVVHKHHFSNIQSFIQYFFKYGKKYAITLKKHPSLIRRYALIALVTPFIFSALIYFAYVASIGTLIGFLFLIFFVAMLVYSLTKHRTLISGLVPGLFFLLFLSYVSGFYYGILKK